MKTLNKKEIKQLLKSLEPITLREEFKKKTGEEVILDYNPLPIQELNRKYVLWLESKLNQSHTELIKEVLKKIDKWWKEYETGNGCYGINKLKQALKELEVK